MLRYPRFAILILVGLAACASPNSGGNPNLPPLEVTAVTATSSTSLVVEFDQAITTGAETASNYVIAGGNGASLPVLAAYQLAEGHRVALATDVQGTGPYTLRVRNVARAADGWASPDPTPPASFDGAGGPAPAIGRMVALSSGEVLVTFADAAGNPVAMSDEALRTERYGFGGTGIGAVDVRFDDGGSNRAQVLVRTTALPAGRQRLALPGVTSLVGGALLDPTRAAADFYGITNPDQAAPFVTEAYAPNANTIVVAFSEPVDAGGSAPGPANFALQGPSGAPVTVYAAALEQHGTLARVSVGALAPGATYALDIVGLMDAAGLPLAGLAQATVTVVGPPSGSGPDDVAPRVTGAISTGPTSVVVTFSEPVLGGVDSAENPNHYAIASVGAAAGMAPGTTAGETADGVASAGNAAPDTEHTKNGEDAAAGLDPSAIVTVTAAQLAPNGRSVTLTTLAQSAIEYQLTAVAVADLAGNLLVPPDRDNPYPVTFFGTAGTGSGDDADGDGLNDAEEQRGWTVVVRRADGTTTTRVVTSDPTLADTDDDGVRDGDERAYLTDPRVADTDGDQLSDFWELTYVYSDPTHQDGDEDGLIDGLEWWFFRTSPNLADTDGDQIKDGDEINLGNRNPRLADLPRPGIEVGAVDLQLDVRFSASSQRGTRELETRSVSSTLTQSERQATSNVDSNTQEFTVKVGVEAQWKVGSDFGYRGKFTAETGYTGQWTSSFTQESSRETQNAYARSNETQAELQLGETLSREVQGASIRLTVSLRSLGDIAFSISNLQVTAFLQDARVPGRLVPIATLVPENEPASGYNLGPITPERGPLVFVATQVFPSLVEQLMRDPSGLVFKIANFDVTDEFGRNFAFTSQDVNDRTATVVLDYGAADSDGDGEGDLTERLKVSTSAGRPIADIDGDGDVDEDDRILFDATGHQVGILLTDALETVLGLTHYDEATTPATSLDAVQLQNSYSTRVINGVRVLWRVRSVSRELGNPLKTWVVLTPEGLVAADQDLRDRVLRAGQGVTLAFIQDLDDDGVPARMEYTLGCSDSDLDQLPSGNPDGIADGVDTDLDGLDDRFEAYEGWLVSVRGRGDYRGFASCARTDSDRDGLDDPAEFAAGTDAKLRDTDGDGLTDYEELNGFAIDMRFGPDLPGVTTDPLNPDSDGDTLPDGAERDLGTNPNVNDGDMVFDDDGDGLVNFQETTGWSVTRYAVSTTPLDQGASTTTDVTSDPDVADTDGDGLNDRIESELGTDPRSADTDGDGLSDLAEVDGGTNPLDADTDDDLRSDAAETNTPLTIQVVGQAAYQVTTDPLVADVDFDDLVDGQEQARGTDPTKADTDEDGGGLNDGQEVTVCAGIICRDPLTPDQMLTVTFTLNVDLDGDLDPAGGAGDFTHTLQLQRGAAPTLSRSSQAFVNNNSSSTLWTVSFIRPLAQSLTVDIAVYESDSVAGEGVSCRLDHNQSIGGLPRVINSSNNYNTPQEHDYVGDPLSECLFSVGVSFEAQ